jgi:hypothetical protein
LDSISPSNIVLEDVLEAGFDGGEILDRESGTHDCDNQDYDKRPGVVGSKMDKPVSKI